MRRWLRSAERFSDAAIADGLLSLKTSVLRSSASLVAVTLPDHLRVARPGLAGPDLAGRFRREDLWAECLWAEVDFGIVPVPS